MRKKIFAIIFNFTKKYPIFIISIFIILGILFLLAFKSIPLKSDYIDLLPQNAEPVKNIKYLTEKLKGVGQFSIAVQSESKDIEAMKTFADKLHEEIVNIPEIEYIQYKIPLDFIMNNIFLFIENADLEEIYNRLREKVSYEMFKEMPIYINLEDEEDTVDFNIDDIIEKYKKERGGISASQSEYMISSDNDMLVIFIKPDFMPTEVDKTGLLIKKIKDKIDKINPKKIGKDLEVSFAGTYTLSYDQKNAIYLDISRTSIIAMILVFIAILVFTRNIRNSIILLIALIIGVLSSFGAAFIIFGHLNLITGFLIALLAGLGVNYGIHFLFRYKEERLNESSENALKDSFLKTGLASFTGAATTAVSFFTLAFSKFLGFSEFGLLASVGILFTLFSAYIFVTAFITLFEKIIKTKTPQKVKIDQQTYNDSSNFNHKKIVFFIPSLLLIILTLLFVFNIKNIRFEYDSKKLEVKGQKSIETTEMIQKKFNISTDPAICYSYNREEEKDFYNAVTNMMKEENSVIGNVLSLSGILIDEDTQKEKLVWVKKIKEELESLPENSIKDSEQKKRMELVKKITGSARVITEEDLPENFARRFIAEDNGRKLYITQVFPKKILFDARDMRDYVARIKTIKGEKKTYYPTGLHIIYVFLIETVLRESKIFIGIVFFIIWLILLIDFKSFKDSLIAMIPLIFGILWLVEIMSLFGIKFNFMNIVVLPTVLGTGVDNGVHIYHRYKDCGSIFEAVRKTGIANLGMSLTVAIGWSALFFAHYEGLKTMAFVGVIGILMTFIASVTIMPAVILLSGKKFKN